MQHTIGTRMRYRRRLLPLLPQIRQVIPVVSENNQLLGVVSPSSVIIEMTGKDKGEIKQIVQNAIDL